MANPSDFTCCRNELNLEKLCAHRITADKIFVTDLTATNITQSGAASCLPLLSSPAVCAGVVTSATANIGAANFNTISSASSCATNCMATNISADYITANSGCISGTLNVANLINTGVYRANVVYSAPNVYTLGTDIAFDFIIDDPNTNITLAPTTYTAPVAGYYAVSFTFNSTNLQAPSSGAILGSPVGDLQLYVNGVLHNESFSPYLTFSFEQRAVLSDILQLNKGDTVTMKYQVNAVSPTSGAFNVVGTVDVAGNKTDVNASGFKIHLLSATALATPACAPVVPCIPIAPLTCVPCVPAAASTGS